MAFCSGCPVWLGGALTVDDQVWRIGSLQLGMTLCSIGALAALNVSDEKIGGFCLVWFVFFFFFHVLALISLSLGRPDKVRPLWGGTG